MRTGAEHPRETVGGEVVATAPIGTAGGLHELAQRKAWVLGITVQDFLEALEIPELWTLRKTSNERLAEF